MQSILVFAILCVVSWLLVLKIRKWTQRRRILDIPNERSSHSVPVPRGGGLSIAVLCLIGWWMLLALGVDNNLYGMLCYGVGGILVAVISWFDDVHSLPSWVRFLVHAVAAILLIFGYGAWSVVVLPVVGSLHLGWLGYLIVFLWVVGLTNVYNFMDGIDGIAAIQAIVAACGWIILAEVNADLPEIRWLALFLTAGSVGFLLHNWPPAKIFMGDVGSVFCGYTLAFLALASGHQDPRLCLAGALLVWPFLFDSAFTFFRRLLKRENVFAAHRQHLYQRLITARWSHRATTMLYMALDLTGLYFALLFVAYPGRWSWFKLTAVPCLAFGLWVLVVWEERLFVKRWTPIAGLPNLLQPERARRTPVEQSKEVKNLAGDPQTLDPRQP